jgi:hypothetical protein
MCVYVFDSRFQRISSSALILKPFVYEIFELFLLNRSFSPATGLHLRQPVSLVLQALA